MLMMSGGIGYEQSDGAAPPLMVEFTSEAVRLVREVGVTEAARRFDIPLTLQNWMKPCARY